MCWDLWVLTEPEDKFSSWAIQRCTGLSGTQITASDAGCYKSDPLKLLPVKAVIFAHDMIHLKIFILSCQSLDIFDTCVYTYRILLYVIAMAGFWVILFSMSCRLKGFLWARGLCVSGIASAEGQSSRQCLLLCGSVFDHISLDIYWGTKVISRAQWCFYLIWLQSIAGDIGIAMVFWDEQDLTLQL